MSIDLYRRMQDQINLTGNIENSKKDNKYKTE